MARTNSAQVLNRSNNNSPVKAHELTLARKSFDGMRDNRITEPRSYFNACYTCGDRYFPGHRCKNQNQKLKCLKLGATSESGQILEEDEESESEEEPEP